jgi:hypothetical protein
MVQRRQLDVERVDQRHRDVDLLARRRRQIQRRQPLALLGAHQATTARHTVVIED